MTDSVNFIMLKTETDTDTEREKRNRKRCEKGSKIDVRKTRRERAMGQRKGTGQRERGEEKKERDRP